MKKIIPFLTPLWILALCSVFGFAGGQKIIDPGAFARAIYNYQILPGNLVNLMAIYLPWLEVLCALGLFFPQTRRASALLIAFMLVVFIAAQLMALSKGIDISCGCFSTSEGSKKVGYKGVFLNVTMLLGALWVMYKPCNKA